MTKKQLDQFGQSFIERTLDLAIDKYKMVKASELKSSDALKISKILQEFDGNQRKKIDRIVSDNLENMLHSVLFFFEDNNEWAIVRKDAAEKKDLTNLTDVSDGLTGELYGENGWIEKHSAFRPGSLAKKK